MTSIYIWTIFAVISIILLIIYWGKKNAVWGGLSIGIVVGLIITIVYFLKDNDFSWVVIGKSALLGTMIGFVAELLGMVSDLIRNKNRSTD